MDCQLVRGIGMEGEGQSGALCIQLRLDTLKRCNGKQRLSNASTEAGDDGAWTRNSARVTVGEQCFDRVKRDKAYGISPPR